MDAFDVIINMINDLKKQQDATYETLASRLDAIDRQTDIPLTASQAAVFLGCSTHTVINYHNRGILPKVTRNGLVGYLRQDLEKIKKRKK